VCTLGQLVRLPRERALKTSLILLKVAIFKKRISFSSGKRIRGKERVHSVCEFLYTERMIIAREKFGKIGVRGLGTNRPTA